MLAGVALALAAAGCGANDPPEASDLNYEATRFIITDQVGSLDALTAGATLMLTLRQDGGTEGSLVLPAAVTGAAQLTADLSGTWVQRNDTIVVDTPFQTFVSEVTWILTPETIRTTDTYDGDEYDVVLTRIFF